MGYQHNDAYTAYLPHGNSAPVDARAGEQAQRSEHGAPENVADAKVENGIYKFDLPLRPNDVYLIVLTPIAKSK